MTDNAPPEAQWEAWEQMLVARLREFGISRLADTTGLDTTGVPTASVTKPGTSDVIWVYSGKGRSQAQARVTAVMECLERSGALWPSEPVWVTEKSAVLRHSHEVWGPERFTYRRRDAVAPDDPQVWVAATKITGNCGRVMVPADVCFNGRRPPGLAASPFQLSTSNGLAAAFRLEDALTHGLLEVIERHIVSCAEVRASHLGFSFLAAVAEQFGLDSSLLSRYEDDADLAVTVEQASLPESVSRIVRHYESAGLDLVVKMLPNEFSFPAYGVSAVQRSGIARHLGCAGYGVRSTGAAALEAALLELAQTRATDLQGAREDRREPEKQHLEHNPEHHWLTTPGTRPIPYRPHDVEPDLDRLLERCADGGLPEAAYVEFPGWSGISVVRVLVPHAETWHVTGGWSSFGPQLRESSRGC